VRFAMLIFQSSQSSHFTPNLNLRLPPHPLYIAPCT
jgi:hypothetical protein